MFPFHYICFLLWTQFLAILDCVRGSKTVTNLRFTRLSLNNILKQPWLRSLMSGKKWKHGSVKCHPFHSMCCCTSAQRKGVKRERESQQDRLGKRESKTTDRDTVSRRTSKQGFNFPGGPAGILWFSIHQSVLKRTQSDQMKPNGNPTVTSRPIKAQPIPMVSDDLWQVRLYVRREGDGVQCCHWAPPVQNCIHVC